MLGLTAENIGTILTGLGFAMIGLLGGRSLKGAGKPPPQPAMEIAGAIISDKKAVEIIEAAERLEKAIVSHRAALDRNTKACEGMGEVIEDVKKGIADLATEYKIDRAIRNRQ